MATATLTRTKKTSAARAEQREQELTALKEAFNQKVLSLRDSDQWKQMLKTMSYFHDYSFHNTLLIWLQKPEATYCTGYKAWQALGYQVRKGEKGLRIFAPYTYTRKDKDGNTLVDEDGNELKGTGFRPVSTFDISQVEPTDKARPIETLEPKELTGADEHGLILSIGDALRAKGWKVEFKAIAGGAKGFTRPSEKLVVIDEQMAPAQQAKTMIHEAAHVLLHADNPMADYHQHRGLCETEAESVAYVVAGALGWDTADYSVSYVAGWSNGKPETLEAAGKNVLKATQTILGWLKDNPR